MRNPIEVSEELKHYFAFNMPLQVWPVFAAHPRNEENEGRENPVVDYRILNYMPRKERCTELHLSEVVNLSKISFADFFQIAADNLRHLADLFDEESGRPTNKIYYHDQEIGEPGYYNVEHIQVSKDAFDKYNIMVPEIIHHLETLQDASRIIDMAKDINFSPMSDTEVGVEIQLIQYSKMKDLVSRLKATTAQDLLQLPSYLKLADETAWFSSVGDE
jgi:hypothetical protein